MLVLTLRTGRYIQIGDGIKIHGKAIKGSGMQIGIEVPADVQVVRDDAICKTPKHERTEHGKGKRDGKGDGKGEGEA